MLNQNVLQALPQKPLLSIVVPSFNQGAYIGSTLDSIFLQSYRPIEVIVVDGGSNDDTIQILREYSAKYDSLSWVSETDDGVADAVNKGLKLAKGHVAAIQSSDDIYYAGAFEAAIESLKKNPHCGIVYGDSDTVNSDNKIIAHYKVPDFSWEGVFGISLSLPQQCTFFRTDVSRAIDGWKSQYYSCDLDFWMRMLLQAPAVKASIVFSAWRSHEDQRTVPAHFEHIWRGYWRMIEESDELKRAPRRLRRLASASRHIMAFRCHPTGNLYALRWHALLAFVLFPGFFRYLSPRQLRPLIPGYTLVRKLRGKKREFVRIIDGPTATPGMPRPVFEEFQSSL